MNHIRDKLPDMKARLNTLMGQAQQELNSFGDSAIFGDKNQVRSISCSPIDLITYPQQQGSVILRLMTQFARDFISSHRRHQGQHQHKRAIWRCTHLLHLQ